MLRMKPNLSIIRDRLDGAEADFEAFAKEFNARINSTDKHTQAIDFDFKPYPDQDHQLVYVSRTLTIPPLWGRRVAHILYDVRSALDHLVHELYVASNKRRPPSDIAEVLAFPICDKRTAWTHASRQGGKKPSRLEGIDRRFVKVIRHHQPFRRLKSRTRHALLRLQTFNDLDKHRRPYVVLFAPGDLQIGYQAGPSCRVLKFEPLPLGRVLKVGTKLAYMEVTATSVRNDVCVNVALIGPVKPALDRGVLLDDLLAKVLAEARWIVTDCEAAL